MANHRDHSPDDANSSSAELQQAALDGALKHLVGESRAWLLQVEHYLNDLSSLHDERTARVVEALDLTMAEPARPGTLRHLKLRPMSCALDSGEPTPDDSALLGAERCTS